MEHLKVEMELQGKQGKKSNDEGTLVETILHQDALINGVQDTIWSVDSEMRLITANQSFVERIRMATGKTIKQGDSVLIKEFGHERLDKWRRYYERALKGEPFTIKEETYDPTQQTTIIV
ncbi:MAG TPA: hypothetical protein VHS53_18155 [Mucilaginibacter sp.]|nr:hypothetical protein [Mucilaginibacter sp.]